jgi:hypothetical protein
MGEELVRELFLQQIEIDDYCAQSQTQQLAVVLLEPNVYFVCGLAGGD